MNSFDLASEAAFADYVDSLADVIGHADRVEPLGDYCLGLLLPVERKSLLWLPPVKQEVCEPVSR